MNGAVHISGRLDGQPDRAAQATKPKVDVSLVTTPDTTDNPRKRHSEDLPHNPSKRRHIDSQLYMPPSGLRGGQDEDEARKLGFRGVLRDLFAIKRRHRHMFSINNGHINPSSTNNICSDQNLQLGESIISLSALQTAFQPSDHREQAACNVLRDLIKLCEETPSRLYPQTQDHLQQQKDQKRLQQVLDALDSTSTDNFDTTGTRFALEDLRAFVETACRAATKNADEKAEKEAALTNTAATVADYQKRLDRQRKFAAKVFMDGEQMAGVFVQWIRKSRERFGEELEIGERAGQKPRPAMQTKGFSGRFIVYAV